jgi:hypothetical protein
MTFTRWPSSARNKDWLADIPRWLAATKMTMTASSATSHSTRRVSGEADDIAATTPSTISWPT